MNIAMTTHTFVIEDFPKEVEKCERLFSFRDCPKPALDRYQRSKEIEKYSSHFGGISPGSLTLSCWDLNHTGELERHNCVSNVTI